MSVDQENTASGVDLAMFKKDLYNDKVLADMVKKHSTEIEKIQSQEVMIVNVKETMDDLCKVTILLQVADKTSDGFNVNVAIKDILVKYQSLLKDCVEQLGYFKQSTRSALEQYTDVATFVDIGDIGEAITIISKCADNAKDLATRAKGLADKTNNLNDKTGEALVKATAEDVDNQKLQRTVQDELNTQKAESASRKKMVVELDKQVQEYSVKEKTALAKADKESNRAFAISLVGAVTSGLGGLLKGGSHSSANTPQIDEKTDERREKENELKSCVDKICATKDALSKKKVAPASAKEISTLKDNITELKSKKKELTGAIKALSQSIDRLYTVASNNADRAEENAERISKLLFEIKNKDIENKAALAALVIKTANSNIELGDLETAIKMIKLTERALGQVATALSNTALFWIQEGHQFANLENIGTRAGDYLKKTVDTNTKERETFLKVAREKIKLSGMRWLTMYSINSDAVIYIVRAFDKINKVMCNLGGSESKQDMIKDAQRALKALGPKMNKQVEDEKKQLDALKAQCAIKA